jgi:hypothetical protein
LGKKKEPIDDDKKVKWANRTDGVRGLIIMSISPDLRLHLNGIDDLEEDWENIESVFGKLNIIREKQLENQVLTLIPSVFCFLGDSLSKFKTLRILCEECEIKMEEECFIYPILSKIGLYLYIPFML